VKFTTHSFDNIIGERMLIRRIKPADLSAGPKPTRIGGVFAGTILRIEQIPGILRIRLPRMIKIWDGNTGTDIKLLIPRGIDPQVLIIGQSIALKLEMDIVEGNLPVLRKVDFVLRKASDNSIDHTLMDARNALLGSPTIIGIE
jgi:hypothetical protein